VVLLRKQIVPTSIPYIDPIPPRNLASINEDLRVDIPRTYPYAKRTSVIDKQGVGLLGGRLLVWGGGIDYCRS